MAQGMQTVFLHPPPRKIQKRRSHVLAPGAQTGRECAASLWPWFSLSRSRLQGWLFLKQAVCAAWRIPGGAGGGGDEQPAGAHGAQTPAVSTRLNPVICSSHFSHLKWAGSGETWGLGSKSGLWEHRDVTVLSSGRRGGVRVWRPLAGQGRPRQRSALVCFISSAL